MKTPSIVIVMLLVVAGSCAIANQAPDRPQGVAAANWYPINERLGLVVPDYQPDFDQALVAPDVLPTRVAKLPPPPLKPSGQPPAPPSEKWLKGYLMVKEGERWERVAVAGSPSLLKQLTYRP